MNYKFILTLPKREDFRCEVAIDSDQTFAELSDFIASILHFDRANMPVFFTLDDDGNRKREIAMFGFEGDDSAPLVMAETRIRDVINPSCMECIYVYDVPVDEFIHIEYDGGYFAEDDEVMPKCLLLEGRLPVIKSLVKAFIRKRNDDNLDKLFPPEPVPERDRGGDDDDMFEDFDADDSFDEEFDDEFEEFGASRRSGASFESLDNYVDTI